jgi:hypothetical protein
MRELLARNNSLFHFPKTMKREPWEPDENGDTFAMRLKKLEGQTGTEATRDTSENSPVFRENWRNLQPL